MSVLCHPPQEWHQTVSSDIRRVDFDVTLPFFNCGPWYAVWLRPAGDWGGSAEIDMLENPNWGQPGVAYGGCHNGHGQCSEQPDMGVKSRKFHVTACIDRDNNKAWAAHCAAGTSCGCSSGSVKNGMPLTSGGADQEWKIIADIHGTIGTPWYMQVKNLQLSSSL